MRVYGSYEEDFLCRRQICMDFYFNYTTQMGSPVVFLPLNLQRHLVQHSGMTEISCFQFIKEVLANYNHSAPDELLTSVILVLAELPPLNAVGSKDIVDTVGKPWVPLRLGEYGHIQNAFDATQKSLQNLHVFARYAVKFDFTVIRNFDETVALATMKNWGLKVCLNWKDVVNEASYINESKDLTAAQHFCAYMTTSTVEEYGTYTKPWALANLKDCVFVPAARHKQEVDSIATYRPMLSSPSTLYSEIDRKYVWAVSATSIVSFDFGFQVVEASVLVNQIAALANEFSDSRTDDRKKRIASHIFIAFEKLVSCKCNIYDAMAAELEDVAWVLCESPAVTECILKPAREVVLHQKHSLIPALWTVSSQWKTQFPEAVFIASGVSNRASVTQLSAYLEYIAKRAAGKKLDPATLSTAINVCNEYADVAQSETPAMSTSCASPLMIPTASCQLYPSDEVYINDAQWVSSRVPSKKSIVNYLHPELSTHCGRLLGCTSAREEIARLCEDQFHSIGEDFGQREQLADRISGVLGDYDQPEDVFIEHWQNCDDAEASDIMFMFDSNSYGNVNLVDDRASRLQGPSLIMASSKALSEDDIARIQRIGRSEKKNRFVSTGRFGIGLNSFYHFADAFELLANDSLFIFDPLNVVVATPDKPAGRRYQISKLRANFPDMLAPFKALSSKRYPTIFRLPLRCGGKSKFGGIVTNDTVQKYLQGLCGKLTGLLMFSKHIQNATVTLIDDRGKINQLAHLTCSETVCTRYLRSLPSSVEALVSLSPEAECTLSDDVKIAGSIGGNHVSSSWIVSHVLDSSPNTIKLLAAMMEGGGPALLPHGAAALKISGSDEFQGKICSYFPVAKHNLGLPLLLHGAFNLHSSRKLIPLQDSNDRRKNSAMAELWNTCIVNTAMARALIALLLQLRGRVTVSDLDSQFFDILCLSDSISGNSSNTQGLRSILRTAVLQRIITEDICFFPVTNDHEVKKWLPLKGGQFRSRSHLVGELFLDDDVENILVDTGMDLKYISKGLVSEIRDERSLGELASLIHKLDGPDICSHLKQMAFDFIPFQQVGHANQLLKYSLVGMSLSTEFTMLHGVPLLVTSSNTGCPYVRRFDIDSPVYVGDAMIMPFSEFIIEDQFDIFLYVAENKRVDLFKKLANIGIKKLSVADLLPRVDEFHSDEWSTVTLFNDKWLKKFWNLLISSKKLQDSNNAACELKAWEVVKVQSKTGPRQISFAEMTSSAFMLSSIDKDWQKEIGMLLVDAGFCVLDNFHEDHFESLRPFVSSDTAGILHILNHINWDDVSLKNRTSILAYFSCRHTLSREDELKLRTLPLFPLQLKADDGVCHFTALLPNMSYICLHSSELSCAGYLAQLPLSGVCVLAWPCKKVEFVYNNLDIKKSTHLDFINKYIADRLPELARDVRVLEKVLHAVELVLTSTSIENHIRREEVCRILGGIAFVVTQTGKLIPPKDVVNPRQLHHDAFNGVLRAWMPVPELALFDDLLEKLGMSRILAPDKLLLCCKHLHDTYQLRLNSATADPMSDFEVCDDAVRGMSHAVVEMLCCSFRRELELNRTWVFEKNSEMMETLIKCCSQHTILLAYRVCDVLSENSASHKVILTSMSPSTKVVTADLAVLASASYAVVAHGIDDGKTGELTTLLRFNAEEPFRKIGLISQDSQIDKYTLLTQLYEVSKCAACREMYKFPSSSPLKNIIDAILKALSKLRKRALSNTEDDIERTQNILAMLNETPCIPIEFTRDASGSLAEPFVKLVAPARTFKKFPFRNDFMHSLANDFVSHDAVIMRELGVLDEPDFRHYALLTKLIYDAVDANGSCDIGPNEAKLVEKAVEMAVKKAVHRDFGSPLLKEGEEESEFPLQMYLFDEDGVLRPSDALVWVDADSMHLKQRCNGLFNPSPEQPARWHILGVIDNFTLTDYQILVSRTSLSMLSRYIKEESNIVTQGTVCQGPNSFEEQFLDFFRSRDFAVGIHSIMAHELYESEIDVELVMKALDNLTVEWVNDIQTSIKAAVGADVWETITGSETHVAAFANFESNPTTIQAIGGVIGSREPKEESFFAAFSTQVVGFLLTRFKLSRNINRLPVEAMLRKWHEGGEAALAMLGEHRIPIASKSTRHQHLAGDLVPIHLHHLISQSFLCVFEEGEMVAVDADELDEEGTRRYKYATVCPSAIGNKQVGNGTTDLSRLYLLKLSRDNFSALPHAFLYKIDSQSTSCKPHSMDLVSRVGGEAGYSGHRDELQEDAHNRDFKILKDILQQMESLDEQAYRKAVRRQWLQWHPDKCNKSYAAEFFKIIHRHAECYAEGGDYSWLHGMQDTDSFAFKNPVTPEQWRRSTEHWNSSPSFEWFAEMEKERKSTAHAEQHAATTSAYPQRTSARVPVAVTSPSENKAPRLCDHDVADVMWSQACYELKVAKVLYDASMWAKVVWQAQQAIEMSVKSLMLRTCGISTEEMKGLGAHDVAQLWGRIEHDKTKDGEDDVVTLHAEAINKMSRAYIGARYPSFPPTGVAQLNPFEKYNKSDADECLNAAKNFMAWAVTCEYFEVSRRPKRRQSDLGDTLDRSDESGEDIEPYQPSPPPPAPVVPMLPSPPVAGRTGAICNESDGNESDGSLSEQRAWWDRQYAYDQELRGPNNIYQTLL